MIDIQPIEGPESPESDANRDGIVSAGDYASVQANFGNTSVSVVSEAATMSLLALGSCTVETRK